MEAGDVEGENADDAPSGNGKGKPPAAPTFLDAAKAAACQLLVVDAAEVADAAGRGVARCFAPGTDYLNLMAQVFGEALGGAAEAVDAQAGPASTPGALFYLLVPALSLSFLDSLIVGREVLTKRAVASTSVLRSNAIMFDDGFALGIACILQILHQEPDFLALHWFEANVSGGAEAGPAAAAAAAAAMPSDVGRAAMDVRLEAFARELGRLEALWEASSSLFGSIDRRGTGVAVQKTGTQTETNAADNLET
eukprot:TRINITY_DN19969_c0_g1_i2.p1 TRINITY_DN19969_c0_g1~~TRINITY_DN19969_c0_g1_i2.p1  ORF type:complete len:278 (+),score=48.93 TRINITY_DN19969_c0_g1_i2:80-835(+)